MAAGIALLVALPNLIIGGRSRAWMLQQQEPFIRYRWWWARATLVLCAFVVVLMFVVGFVSLF